MVEHQSDQRASELAASAHSRFSRTAALFAGLLVELRVVSLNAG